MSANSTLYERVCFTHPRDKWLECRKGYLCASEIAAVLGADRYASPLSVYADKINPEIEPERLTKYGPMYWGTVIEPLVINAFAEATDRHVIHCEEMIRSTVRPWQACTLDGQQECDEYDGPGVLEVKCTTRFERWDEQIPVDVFLQVQQQLAVTGWAWGSVAVLFQGRDFHYMDVPRDEEVIARINEAGERFWNRVQRLEDPDADGHTATTEALKRLYPQDSNPSSIELPPHFKALDESRCALDRQMAEIKAERDEIDNKIRAELKTHSVGYVGDVSYTWKANKRGVRSLRRNG